MWRSYKHLVGVEFIRRFLRDTAKETRETGKLAIPMRSKL